jgi:hypothetical protein
MAHLLSFCCLKGYFDHDCLYAVISGQDYRHTGNRLKSITCIRKKGGKIMFSKVKKGKEVLFVRIILKDFQSRCCQF